MDFLKGISEFGYLIIIPGMWLADLPTLLAGGFAIVYWKFDPFLIFGLAIVSRLVFDMILFFAGRHHLKHIIRYHYWVRLTFSKAQKILERYRMLTIFTYHFLQGFKIAIPLALGAGKIGWKKFLLLNIIGTAIWAATIITIGALVASSIS